VSAYGVARFCRDCLREPDVRALALADPPAALDRYDIAPAERRLLLAGEVGEMYRAGCNAFLLSYLPRWGVFGLDVPTYAERMRAARGAPTDA
jgi:hypothetical protein